jgi:hypothetical protein
MVACQPVTMPYRRYSTESAAWRSVFVGDIAQDIRERPKSNPKALERELGSQ